VEAFELAVYRDEHVVPAPPDANRAFVVVGARPDQRFDQPVPLWWSADSTIQDLIQLGTAVSHSAAQHCPVHPAALH